MADISFKIKQLTNRVFKQAGENKCPYVRRDDVSPYCSIGLKGRIIADERRMVCGYPHSFSSIMVYVF